MSLTRESSRTLLYKKMLQVPCSICCQNTLATIVLTYEFYTLPGPTCSNGFILDEELIHSSIKSGLPTTPLNPIQTYVRGYTDE